MSVYVCECVSDVYARRKREIQHVHIVCEVYQTEVAVDYCFFLDPLLPETGFMETRPQEVQHRRRINPTYTVYKCMTDNCYTQCNSTLTIHWRVQS